jgi:hypothetical protein
LYPGEHRRRQKQKHHVPQVGLQQVPVGWFFDRR